MSLSLFLFLKTSSLHEAHTEVNININKVIFTLVLHHFLFMFNTIQ